MKTLTITRFLISAARIAYRHLTPQAFGVYNKPKQNRNGGCKNEWQSYYNQFRRQVENIPWSRWPDIGQPKARQNHRGAMQGVGQTVRRTTSTTRWAHCVTSANAADGDTIITPP
ncbi:MAG: hypothetical protein WCJ07_09005 [Verrucomicrobiota bacterium]